MEISRKERTPEAYSRISIDLGNTKNVGTDLDLYISGGFLEVASYNGDMTAYIKLDSVQSQPIYLSEVKRIEGVFHKLFLTNPAAQAGKIWTIYVIEARKAGKIICNV